MPAVATSRQLFDNYMGHEAGRPEQHQTQRLRPAGDVKRVNMQCEQREVLNFCFRMFALYENKLGATVKTRVRLTCERGLSDGLDLRLDGR